MTSHLTNSRPRHDGVVLAGGGLAGQRCAETLRRSGYDGPIRMVCGELHPPYDRPPLSKEALIHGARAGELSYRTAAWYAEHAVDLLLGVAAAGLEPDRRRLRLSAGGSLQYSRLLIATGARPRLLPELSGYDNVSVLRTVEDAERLRAALADRRPLVLIGGGFIGLEIASAARALDVPVTLVEAAPCPLEPMLGRRLGGWFARLHAEEGVDVRTGTGVDRVIGGANVRGLRLTNGAVIEAGHVVVGIGVTPAVEWLREAGLAPGAGVPVDAHGRTAVEDVYAAGDAAATFHPGWRRHIPGSHWEAAGRQGARAARLMLGLRPLPAALTSFWTDQYGLRIQFIGHRRPGDELTVDGDVAGRAFTATFSRAGRPAAALLVNQPHRLPAIRSAIEKGRTQHELFS